MIRRWVSSDAEPSYAVYVDAVRNGADEHYSMEQRKAWVPSEKIEDWWTRRLLEDAVWVAEDHHGLSGLIALRPDGYLDLFFVLPRARGDGTAAALYSALLAEAAQRGLASLTCHASDYLKPFLEKRGWVLLKEEQATRSGVTLRRWEMVLDQVESSHCS